MTNISDNQQTPSFGGFKKGGGVKLTATPQLGGTSLSKVQGNAAGGVTVPVSEIANQAFFGASLNIQNSRPSNPATHTNPRGPQHSVKTCT
jgi:hypothetical protein